jgi:hypothetical protein
MPPPKTAPAELEPNRVCTQAGNANTHPGTAAKDALRVRNPPRDQAIIQKEKVDKEVKRVEKQKMLEEAHAKVDSANCFIEEYCARKETEALNESAVISCWKPKG